MPEDSEPDWYVIHQWCQRAKRKNKYKQFKRTIKHLRSELKCRDMWVDYLAEKIKKLDAENDKLMHDRLVLHIRIAKLQRELKQ